MTGEQGDQPSQRSTKAAVFITPAICVCWALVYAILCRPAIQQRGFPPIDPAWQAVTFLWVSAILLCVILDPRPFKKRAKVLAVYCLVTSFVDAGTFVGVVPRTVTFLDTLLTTLFIAGPMHLVVWVVVEGLVGAAGDAAYPVYRRLRPTTVRLARWGLFSTVIVLSGVFPFAFRTCVFADLRYRGQARAEQDWKDHRAILYREYEPTEVKYRYDRATGLKLRNTHFPDHYWAAYSKRVDELLEEQGVPSWSMKGFVPTEHDLLDMLDSGRLEPVSRFPYDINANITVFRGGTIRRWRTSISGSGGLTIATVEDDLIEVGGGSGRVQLEPVFVGKMPNYPGVIVIREGTGWIGAFHESGKRLCDVYRREPPPGTARSPSP